MHAFVFLSIVALFSFFAFEPPGPVTKDEGPGVVVAVVHADATTKADAWLQKQGEVSPNTEVTPDVLAPVQEDTIAPAEVPAAPEVGVPIAEPPVSAPPEEKPSEVVPEVSADDALKEAEAAAVTLPEQDAAPEVVDIPAVSSEEAIPLPVLVLEEGTENAPVPHEAVTEENLIEKLQEAGE